MADNIPMMDWKSSNIAESFQFFKQRLELYFLVKKVKAEFKVPAILLAAGDEGLRRFNCWNLSPEEAKNPEVVLQKFLVQLEPPTNFRICRLQLSAYRMKAAESIDDFVNRCQQLALKCEFNEKELNDRVIEAIIQSTPLIEFQNELLTKNNTLTVAQAIAIGRTHAAVIEYTNCDDIA